jgi:hypothetical protein
MGASQTRPRLSCNANRHPFPISLNVISILQPIWSTIWRTRPRKRTNQQLPICLPSIFKPSRCLRS